jgi:hypothetical protein
MKYYKNYCTCYFESQYENINGIILKKFNIDLDEIYMFINDAKYFLNSIHINKNILDV